MSSPLRPQFFCSRPNGTLTPLIALDELPAHISIRGIPRTMSPGDTIGMTSLGTVLPRAHFYIVDGVQPAPIGTAPIGMTNAVRDSDAQTAVYTIASDETVVYNPRVAHQQQHPQNWIAPTAPGAGPANQVASTHSGRSNGKHDRRDRSSSDENRKVFCSFWLRKGECDYTQQGCKFKHEMPMDDLTLSRCGLRDIPQWYREKFGVPSIHARGNNNTRAQIASGQPWRQNMRTNQNQSTPTKSISHQPRMEIAAANTEVPQEQSVGLTESNKQNLPGPQPKGTKKIDLMSFDPMPDYPALNAGRDYSSDDTASPERTKNADLMFKFGPMLRGSEERPESPVKNMSTKSRMKKPSRSRRLYEPRTENIGQHKSGVPADNSLTPLKTNFDNNNRTSESTSTSTTTPERMRTPPLTASPSDSSPSISYESPSKLTQRALLTSFSPESMIYSTAFAKSVISGETIDTLDYLERALIRFKTAGLDDDNVKSE